MWVEGLYSHPSYEKRYKMEPATNSTVTNWKAALPANQRNLRDISNTAIWSLSSCKTGYGVDNVLDNNADTYWQSDGPSPHIVNVQFLRKTTMSYFALYVDFKADESYTPSRISIKVGMHTDDLREVKHTELSEPCGWQFVDLRDSSTETPVRAFMLQLSILQNHHNGRDTHIRQLKVLAPTVDVHNGLHTMVSPNGVPVTQKHPTTAAFARLSTIR